MQAIILAAGCGSRLGGNIPKALLEINGQTLIERLIDQLNALGISNIVLVTGFKRIDLEAEVLQYPVTVVENPIYDSSDNLVSFWYGSKDVHEDCLMIHSDVIVEDAVIQKVIDSASDVVLPYDVRSLDEESMKIKLDQGRVSGLSKHLALDDATGESIPLMKFSAQALQQLKTILSATVANGDLNRLLDSAVLELIQSNQIRCDALNVTGHKWYEIDTHQDWVKASELFKL
jgi:L-glutamine-phosphate cytidylyltransferase